jgi:hypothetical protein
MSFEKKYEEWKKKKQTEEKENSVGTSFEDRYTNWQIRTNGEEILNNLSTRFNSWLSDYDSLAKDYSSRYSNVDASKYRSDTDDWLSKISSRVQSNKEAASELNEIVEQYKDYLDPEWVKNFYAATTKADRYRRGMLSDAEKESEYWSQWDSEDSYYDTYYGNKYAGKTYTEAKEAYQNTEGKEADWLGKNLDYFMSSEEAQERIDFYEGVKEGHRKMAAGGDNFFESIWNLAKATFSPDSAGKEYDEKISKYKNIKRQAARREEYQQFASVTDENSEFFDPDFESYVKLGEEKGLTPAENRSAGPYTNGIIAERNGKNSYMAAADDHAKYMTDDEYKLYAYYYGKYGEEKANEFFVTIQENLNTREAVDVAKDTDALEAMFYAVYAGLDQFGQGMQSLFSDAEYHTPSTAQIASGMIRENLADTGPKLPDWLGGGSLGQLGYDAINTTSNMLPSILASAGANFIAPGSGAVVGTTLMGASAAGHGKAEMINLGYSQAQANAYGLMVGASEAGLQYFLGGITSLGGNSTGLTKLALSKVDNTFARVAISLGGSMLSEGFEEGLQTVIEPWLKEIATGVDWESPDIDEVLYNSLLGALSAFGLEGGQTVAGEVNYSQALTNNGKGILSTNGGYDALKNLANDVSSEGLVKSEADIKNLVGKTQTGVDAINKGKASKWQKNKTAKNVALLSKSVDSVRNEQNLAEIRSSLESKGLSKSQANKAARLLNEALYTDGAYSKELYKSVMNDKGVWDTLRELVTSPDSPLKSRNLKHKLGRVGLKVGENGTIVSSVSTEGTESGYVDESLSFVEDASKREYTASTEGKTIVKTTGDTVDIVEVASIKDGQMMLKVKDADGVETEVNARDVEYSSGNEALIYEAVAHMGLNAVSANSIIKSYNPTQNAGAFARGVQEAYRYGKYNYSENEMYREGSFLHDLTDAQIQRAYKLGQIQSGSDTAVAVAKLKEAIANSKGKKGEGKVHFEGDAVGIDENKLNDRQRVSLKTMEMLSKALGIEFYVYSSYVNKNGERVYKTADGKVKPAPNGVYDKVTGAIHIDLNAGEKGEGTMLFTVAHELTHFIKAWSPAKFKVLANFLVEQYGKKGMSVEELVRRQMANMKANGRTNVTYEKAFEEFVADSMQTMLTSGNVIESLAEIKRRDEGLWNKIKEFFTDLVEHLKKVVNAYSEFAPDTVEGQTVAEMTDVIEQLEKLFTEGLVDASENFRAISSTEAQTLAEVGISFDADTQSVAPELFSERTWTASEYVQNKEEAIKAISKQLGVSESKARQYVDDINSIARLIADDRVRLDYEPNMDDGATVLKPNSEYKYTVDMSTLCAKRLLFTGTFDAIQKALPNTVFDSDDIVRLRKMMQDRNLEVACGICYVESTRREIGRITQEFIDRYKVAQKNGKPITRVNSSGKEVALSAKGKTFMADPNYTPNLGELNTTDIDIVKRDHREVYDAYLAFMNARGQAKPKLLETRAEYKGEILKHFKAKSAVNSRNAHGGLRLQSFSDFEVPHMIDMMQVIMDMARVGLKSQAYTKVPAFAEVFGGTGVKINLSLIAKGSGLDADGNLVFDDTEGINHKEAFRLRDKYSRNVGTILVGKSDAHIIAAMADPRIDFIIPFHKSSWKESLYDALGLTGYDDYTEVQNEKPIDKERKIENFDPSEYWDFSKSGDENAQIYLQKCREDGRIPKFAQFQSYPGYWKLLIDFKMYDNNGVGVPQEVVQPNFDMDSANRILSEYKGGHKTYPVAKDVVADFVKEFSETKATDNFMFSFRKYTDKQRENWKNAKRIVLYENDVQFMDFIKEARFDESFIKKIYFGAIPHDLAVLIKSNTGIDVEDFNCSLSAYEIRKIFKDHGDEKKEAPRGQRAITDSDIVDIPKVIQSPNGVKLSDKQYNGKPVIEFEKQINGSRFSVSAVVSDKHLDLFVQTAYVGIKKGNLAVPIGEQAPINTPLANNGTVSKDRIAQNPNSVNTSEKFSFSERTEAPPTKTEKAYKLMRLVDGKLYPLFIGNNEEVRVGTWYNADSPNLSQLKNLAPGTHLVDMKTGEAMTWDEYAEKHVPKKNGKPTRSKPSKDDVHWANDNGYRFMHIEEKAGGRSADTMLKKYGDTRAYYNWGVNGSSKTESGEGSASLYALRPGWHFGEVPSMHQIGYDGVEGDTVRLDNQVWVEVEMSADVDYNAEAEANWSGDIPTHIPTNGYYRFATNPTQKKTKGGDTANDATKADWYVAGAFKVNRIMSDSEADAIVENYNKKHGKNIPLDYRRNYGRVFNAETMSLEDRDILFSERNSIPVSNRALLANALESAVTNEFERKTLNDYKEELGRADALEKELGEIRSKIRELSFAKGHKDTEGLRKLREQEVKTVNRIDIRDKKLLRLEATKPLKDIIHRERQKAYKRAEKEGKEALAKYREKTAETQRELLNRWQESRHKAVEGRNKTAMRHKIRGIVSELNNLLLHGTKDKHVMIGLQKAVASALDAVNMDTVGAEERVAKYNALIAKEKNPDIIESLTATRDRILAQGNNIGEKLANLKNAYSEIKNSDDPLIANSYDEVIFSKIEAVVESVGNTPLRDMSLSQLEDVYDLYKMVLTTIRNSNKAFKAKKGEEISVLSNRVMEEVEAVGGKKNLTLKATEGLKKYGWSILKPVYAFKLIGSKTFSEVFDNVRAGEDTWAKDVSEAKDFRTATFKKYNYKNWDFNKKYTFTSKSGTSFELTLEQILSLYAYSKRKQADDHLEKGGFVFDTAIEVTEKKHGIPLKYNVNTATAHQVSKETLAQIIGNLTTEQKGFVDEMQDYLSSVMGEKGNEVSLEMYGVKLFKEKFYFPLKSARQFMFEQNEVAGEVKIKNSGFSKETVAKANNPIILNNFMDVWANHVNDMSMYHSFVLALEDFNRVYNYKTPTTDDMQTESVKMYLQNAYGTQSADYIKQLLTDLNGGARSDPQAGIINKAIGKFKKAKVFASLSVVIQQPSALGRAFAYVDPKYFVGKKVNKNEQMKTWSEVKKYAPVAIIKEMGYFDVGNGRSTVSYLKGDKSVMDYVDDVASWLPAKADELTWCTIWEAVKRETADKNKTLKVGSEEFLKVAGERFTEVIVNTQVYDSVLSRSGMMRSKDTGVKMATAFMAESTTAMNMMVDAHLQTKRGNKKFARKIRGGVVASIVINSILVSLVYASRDDDEDETYIEKYLGSLTSELIDGFNPLTYLPYVKDLWSIGQGYDVERSDMSVFADLTESVEKLFDEDASALDKVTSFTGDVTNLFGLPIKNVLRDVKALFNVANGIIEGTPTTSAGIGYSVMDSVRNAVPIWGRLDSGPSASQKLYNALVSGNKAQINRLEGSYKDEKAYENAVRKALRENDSRIKKAAQARIDGNTEEYKRIAREIISEGHFTQDQVVTAITAEMTKLKKDKPKEEDLDYEETTSMYSASDINYALDNGNTDGAREAIDDLISAKTETYVAKAKAEAEKEGKTFNETKAKREAKAKAESSVKSAISSYWKPKYKEAYKKGDTEEMKRIRYILRDTKLYGSVSDILDTCKGWLKD